MDNQTDRNALTPQIELPDALRRELTTMRRSSDGYRVVKMVKCSLGCGKGKAYSLAHPEQVNAGTWCPTHGWLFFDSVALPPAEQLTLSELEDRRLTEQRSQIAKVRKERKANSG